MKTLENGKDKVATICDALRRETLEPAQREAEQIIQNAREEAEKHLVAAETEAKRIIENGKKKLDQESRVFQSNLEQAGKQAVAALRQDIEDKLFNSELESWLAAQTGTSTVVAKLIEAVVSALEKEGVSADLSAFIPKTVSVDDVNSELGAAVQKKLKDQSVKVGKFSGGAQVRIDGKRVTIDISDTALREMLADYVRKDFRKRLFAEGN